MSCGDAETASPSLWVPVSESLEPTKLTGLLGPFKGLLRALKRFLRDVRRFFPEISSGKLTENYSEIPQNPPKIPPEAFHEDPEIANKPVSAKASSKQGLR